MEDKIYRNIEGLPTDISVVVEYSDFNRKYSKLYFSDYENECKGLKRPKGLRQSPEWIENKVFMAWEKDTPDVEDIFRILAWKAGKIDYKNSKEEEGEPKYYGNWVIGTSLQMRNQIIVEWEAFKDVARVITEIWSKYRKNHNADLAWSELIKLATQTHEETMKGVGSVYLITLLFFITKGDYPIYDRFAMSALTVWKLKKEGKIIPNNAVITGCDLPDKYNASEILNEGKYFEYKKLLSDFCADEYKNKNEWKNNRNVDHELYVFGHFYYS